MNYKLSEEQVSTEYFTNTIENYSNKALILFEILEEKRRLSLEMIDNYKLLIDEHMFNQSMVDSIDLLHRDEIFNSKELRLKSTIAFDIATTCGLILGTGDLEKRLKLIKKVKDLIESVNMKDYKKFIYGY